MHSYSFFPFFSSSKWMTSGDKKVDVCNSPMHTHLTVYYNVNKYEVQYTLYTLKITSLNNPLAMPICSVCTTRRNHNVFQTYTALKVETNMLHEPLPVNDWSSNYLLLSSVTYYQWWVTPNWLLLQLLWALFCHRYRGRVRVVIGCWVRFEVRDR